MYITNLLVETLPESQRTDQTLSNLGLDGSYRYVAIQLPLSRRLKQRINELNDEATSRWKEAFHDLLLSCFEVPGFKVIGLLNLQPMVRTIVVQMERGMDDDAAIGSLKKIFQTLNGKIDSNYGTMVTACVGGIVASFFEIGQSYKKARKLTDYRYVIGKGNCAFFDRIDLPEDHSLVEYKYIHLFESMIKNEDWGGLSDILTSIKNRLISGWVNNSKTAYVYKELFSTTIRHLFEKPDRYMEEIETLNTGIIHFDDLFDDVVDIDVYYREVFELIGELSQYNHIGPHVKKALQIIRNSFSEPITLESVADDLGLSKEYLSRLFKSEMAYNFKAYLTMVRMENAKTLLKTTSKNVHQIRELSGYQTPTQFLRAFKAYEGMTPTKYRQHSRQTQLVES